MESKNKLKLDKRTKFAKFLIKHDAYGKYLDNLYRENGNEDGQEFIKEHAEGNVISGFVWGATIDGHSFWNHLDDLWELEVSNG